MKFLLGIKLERWRLLMLLAVINLTTLFMNSAFGQSFNNEGNFIPAHNGQLYPATITANSITTPVTTLTTKEFNALKSKLLQRVNSAILNLEDEEQNLQSSYNVIWGKDFANNYLDDLKNLKNFLTGKPTVRFNYAYLPDFPTVNNWGTTPVYRTAPNTKFSTSNIKAFDLIKKDPLGDHLFNSYKNAFDNDELAKLEMDMAYIRDWRKIEAWYEQCRKIKDKIEELKEDIFKYRQRDIDDMNEQLNGMKPQSLSIAKKLEKSDLIKSMLWYTGGLININPLLVTVPAKRYPYSEKNYFFSSLKQHIQDSLNKTAVLQDFAQTGKYFNRLLLPVPDPSENSGYRLQEYSSYDNYALTYKPNEKTLEDGLLLRLAVYNIPANKKISFSNASETFVFESRQEHALNKIFEQMSVLTAFGTSNLAVINKLSGLFNSPPLNPIQRNFLAKSTPAALVTPDAYVNMLAYQTEMSSLVLGDSTISLPSDTSSFTRIPKNEKPKRAIFLGDQWVPLTGRHPDEDKRRMIWVTALNDTSSDRPDTSDPLFAKLVEEFIKANTYVYFDYDDIDGSYKKLIVKYNEYREMINQRFNSLEDLSGSAKIKYDTVYAYARITNRSLPPEMTDATIDNEPTFSTATYMVKIPNAPAKLSYSITEQATDGKEPAKEVAKQSLKVIQLSHFDFSVGLAYTVRDYYIAQDGTPLPTSAVGDRFQFTAGIHYYPFGKLNRLHDKFARPIEERFSIFAGLSIAHALDNYYTGISYDWWPGVKTVVGYHFYKNYHYNIINNSIAEKASGIAPAGVFISLNLQPITIGKLFGLFK